MIQTGRVHADSASVKDALVWELSTFLARNKLKANDMLPIADLGQDGINLTQFVEGLIFMIPPLSPWMKRS